MRNYLLSSGASTLRLTGLQAIRPSSWYMVLKRFFQVISGTTHHGWQLMLKRPMSKQDRTALDRLDEERDIAAARSAIYQQDLRRYHSRRIRTRTFQEGDLVLRLIQDQTDMHKLSPPWEGPFLVSKNLHNGSYYLVDIREHKDSRTSEEETKRPWNIAHLRPYYT